MATVDTTAPPTQAALSAIIIVSLVRMFDYRVVLDMWRVSKLDLIPWAVSFIGCTFASISCVHACTVFVLTGVVVKL